MRVSLTEISMDNDGKSAILGFYTKQDDGDKEQKGMTKVVLPLEQARTYVIGETYELLPPHARPKVVKEPTGVQRLLGIMKAESDRLDATKKATKRKAK